MSEERDYRSTVFLPKTDFPMKAGLPQKEPGLLARWQEQGLYQRLRAARKGREKFILHDGPPYANGDMHIGHALNHILKDMVVRTQSLLGKDAPYVPGWDCHGLPIEWKVEEEYRKKKLDKDQVDPVEFRAECRAYAQNWVDVQREQLKRLGVNADWDNPYLTMDFQAEATIVSELLKFAESGQLYRGAKPVMWSPVEKTALAEAEVEYEDIVSTQIDVAFEIVSSPIPELVGAHAVIWTTTPWTIPTNQAIAYGGDVEYQLITHKEFGEEPIRFVVAKNLIQAFDDRYGLFTMDDRGEAGTDRYVAKGLTFKGSDLAGTMVRHPMANLFRRPVLDTGLGSASSAAPEGGSPGPDQVRADAGGAGDSAPRFDPDSPLAEFYTRPRPMLDGSAFVTTDSGTGLVHMAPDHGEDDFDLCKAHGIGPVFAVGPDGVYRDDWPWLGAHDERRRAVINPNFNAPDGPICEDLKSAGALLAASADYQHSYPHSWRSKKKVIFRCTPQWFVPMDRSLDPSTTRCAGGPPPRSGEVQESAAQEPPRNGEGDQPQAGGRVSTLRQTALSAIAATRWVPEKGRNRIGAMVEGRPDWVLSRQRAWGVPITLFVDRKSGEYLCDPAVNARIVAAVREHGVDAWAEDRAQEYLGNEYRAEDYERITDILDVWFDSGCTHAFVLESGRWPDLQWPADLYLEGSDQHRGWFQSSLLQSCGTRGRAPYKAVLTHGFTMDARGEKMSKSKGNTVNPIKVMETNGADIIRLWALSVDYTEDHRIGDEILKGVADQYRKIRNTFRYLLGALDGFSEAERVDVAAMPELERYVLALLAAMDGRLRAAVNDFDFNTYVREIADFCNEDLSAFFFDIRKDCLYCDAADDPKRMAYRTVLDTLFHALVRYAAPVLVFTAEEVWLTRYPEAESVHLLEWPELATHLRRPVLDTGLGSASSAAPEGESQTPDQVRGDELVEKWEIIRLARNRVLRMIEPLRRDKEIGSGLEVQIRLTVANEQWHAWLQSVDLSEIFITASVEVSFGKAGDDDFMISASPTTHHKCGRCWRHLPEVSHDGALCSRCDQVLAGMDAA